MAESDGGSGDISDHIPLLPLLAPLGVGSDDGGSELFVGVLAVHRMMVTMARTAGRVRVRGDVGYWKLTYRYVYRYVYRDVPRHL